MQLSGDLQKLLSQAEAHHKFALAQLISIFERSDDGSKDARVHILNELISRSSGLARIIALTGSPGAGKSTLVGKLGLELLKLDKEMSIAVLAIDPSSHESGGSLLGDRTRTGFPLKENSLTQIYFTARRAAELVL